MKKFIEKIFLCLIVAVVFTGCDSENNGNGGGNGGEVLTPKESKAKLEQVGLELTGKINPADHKEMFETMNEFARLIEEGTMDEEYRVASSVLKSVRLACEKGKMAAPSFDVYKLSDFYGIFTYKEGEWVMTSSTTDLEFHFPANGKSAVLKMSCSGKETGMQVDEESVVMIPEKMEAVLTLDKKELFKLQLTNNLNFEANSAGLKVVLSASGYSFNYEVKLGQTETTSNFMMSKGSEMLLLMKVKLTGEEILNIEEGLNAFETASVNCSVLNKLFVDLNCSAVNSMLKEIYNLDGDDNSKEYNEKAAAFVEKYTKGEIYFEGSKAFATIGVQACLEDSYISNGITREYWSVEPILVFDDETKHSFEDFFDEVSFSEFINSVENLVKLYESYLK